MTQSTKRPRNSAPLAPGRACDMIMAIRASRDQRISDRTAEIAQEVDAAIDRRVKSLVDRVDPELRGQLSRMLAAAQSVFPDDVCGDDGQTYELPPNLMAPVPEKAPGSEIAVDRGEPKSRRVGAGRA